MEPIGLRCGPLGVVLAPAAGGAIARFWRETARGEALELLRPASPEALARRNPWAMASYPLVPWSNRIREGRFAFGGQQVTLPPNRPPSPHPIHGHGWQAAWRVVEADGTGATLEYRHPAGAWPWPYRATQRVTLAPDRLTLDLALTNESAVPMPAGLGCHPYLPRTPGTTLAARVGAMWLTDHDVLPVALTGPPPGQDPGRGLRVDQVALDNGFAGWDGRAVVEWPERRARLVIAATAPLGYLVVYTPPARDFFCVEPVSHATDAVNLATAGRTDTGLLTLPPGDTVRATVTFVPEVDA